MTTTVSQSGCILHRKANTFPPTELLEKILEANPNGWGAATVSEVDGRKFIELNSATEGMELEELQETLKTFPEQDITFYFCNSPAGLSEKDMSPYVLVVKPVEEDPDEEEPQIVAFIEGNFPANAQAGSSHPPEYHLASDVLVPKFEGLFEMVDGDLDKLMLNLMKPHFKKELLLNSVSRGVITLVAANGVCLTFAQNDLSVEGEWGWASNGYGYAVAKKEEPKPVKKPSMFSGKSTVREKANVAPKEAIKEAVKPTETGAALIKNYATTKWKPTTNMSRRERKDAYKMRLGYLPQGWEKGVEVDVFVGPDNKVMTFSQVKALGPLAVGIIGLAKNPPRERDIQPDNVETQDTLAATAEKPVTTEILPIMSPKAREAVNDIRNKDGYKKIIAENAEVISDPKQVKSYETKLATFNEQLGIKTMQEFAMWSFAMIHDLNKTNPSAVENMLWTFMGLWLKQQKLDVAAPTEEVVPPKEKKPSMFKKSAAA